MSLGRLSIAYRPPIRRGNMTPLRLKGKKAFLTPRPVIDQIEEYIQAALSIENKGIYYYFWAYIRYDHHHRKFYNMNPNYQQIYQMAKDAGLSEYDVTELYKILGVERPSCL